MTEERTEAAIYRSGVAARLAGIPVETLRVWERRYRIVGPQLSPRGQRLYSAEEVRRLALIKQLVDMGHPIGVIAGLPTDALMATRAVATTLSSTPAAFDRARSARIVLVGPLISARRLETTLSAHMDVVARCMNVDGATAALADIDADIVVIELPTLNDASLAIVSDVKHACSASQAIVLYRFAPSAVIRQLRAAGNEVARAPSDAAAIESLCRALLPPQHRDVSDPPVPTAAEPPAPRFDADTLAALAGASNTVYCECPRHLVELVLSLGSFERYSAECTNRSPDDAALHEDLRQTAGQARALIEGALIRVARAEGLSITPHPGSTTRSAE